MKRKRKKKKPEVNALFSCAKQRAKERKSWFDKLHQKSSQSEIEWI